MNMSTVMQNFYINRFQDPYRKFSIAIREVSDTISQTTAKMILWCRLDRSWEVCLMKWGSYLRCCSMSFEGWRECFGFSQQYLYKCTYWLNSVSFWSEERWWWPSLVGDFGESIFMKICALFLYYVNSLECLIPVKAWFWHYLPMVIRRPVLKLYNHTWKYLPV